MSKIIGIYKITNLKNGNLYIGASTNCKKRFSDHRTKAINSIKQEDLDKVLYKAIRKHGLENFSFEIIEECLPEELAEKEIYWINYYDSFENSKHYNRSPGGNLIGENQILRGEKSPAHKLKEKDVIFCRELYAKGNNKPKEVWEEFFADKIEYSGFLRMYTGETWSHIKPEVFDVRWGNRRFSKEEKLKIKEEFLASGLNLHQFSQEKKKFIGYGTLWKIINEDVPKEPVRQSKFSLDDARKFKKEFLESNLTLKAFAKTKEGVIGYGTLWNMVNNKGRYSILASEEN